MEKIIGRGDEKKILEEALLSNEPELIAIYGRRRIGKTFLIRNYYQKELVIEFTGVHGAGLKDQLQNFSFALKTAMGIQVPPAIPATWIEAFQYLTDFLKPKIRKQPLVLLFDELPWISTPKSGFLQAFTHWWNSWASKYKEIKVVLCGSAASWIIQHIINDRGGLHNRVTRRIRLLPFTLAETAAFLKAKNIVLDQYQVLQLYMSMGGIPQYLAQVKSGESASQTIDRLCFTRNGPLNGEFKDLYKSLFAHADNHESIIRALSKKAKGMTRAEIIETCQFTSGGWTTKILEELEESGFIVQSLPFERKSRDSIYRLSDEYSLFYLKFIENTKTTGKGTWLRQSQNQSYISWCGFAFESVCLKHIDQIKRKLGISGVYTEQSSWQYNPGKAGSGSQIDLLLDRADRCINLCEVKFSTSEFVITKKYAVELDHKVNSFKEQSNTRKTIFPTMVTTYGTRKNEYYLGRIQAEVLMEDLFR